MQAYKITDKLGMPIDKHILDTVVALHILGFNTTASSGGHIRRNTGGPYVIIQSPKAIKYAERAREIGDTKHPDYIKWCKKANYYRA